MDTFTFTVKVKDSEKPKSVLPKFPGDMFPDNIFQNFVRFEADVVACGDPMEIVIEMRRDSDNELMRRVTIHNLDLS